MTLMTEVAMQTRRYRLKIFDGQYEVLHKWTFYLDADLDSPYLPGYLNERLVALTRQAVAANEPMDAPRLEVWDGNVKLIDWAG